MIPNAAVVSVVPLPEQICITPGIWFVVIDVAAAFVSIPF